MTNKGYWFEGATDVMAIAKRRAAIEAARDRVVEALQSFCYINLFDDTASYQNVVYRLRGNNNEFYDLVNKVLECEAETKELQLKFQNYLGEFPLHGKLQCGENTWRRFCLAGLPFNPDDDNERVRHSTIEMKRLAKQANLEVRELMASGDWGLDFSSKEDTRFDPEAYEKSIHLRSFNGVQNAIYKIALNSIKYTIESDYESVELEKEIRIDVLGFRYQHIIRQLFDSPEEGFKAFRWWMANNIVEVDQVIDLLKEIFPRISFIDFALWMKKQKYGASVSTNKSYVEQVNILLDKYQDACISALTYKNTGSDMGLTKNEQRFFESLPQSTKNELKLILDEEGEEAFKMELGNEFFASINNEASPF